MTHRSIFNIVPTEFEICNLPISELETKNKDKVNSLWKKPMRDNAKIRAFRLMKEKTSWLEIGTETKINLAYMSTVLAANALIIDIDIAKNEEGTNNLKRICSTFQLHQIIASSNSLDTVEAVKKILNNGKLDGIFIDGNHMYEFVFNDFNLYYQFVKDDGYIFFHDIFYAGNEKAKGVLQCLEYINGFIPVYQIHGPNPISRYRPFPTNDTVWGGVAVIRMKDVLTYKYTLQAQQ